MITLGDIVTGVEGVELRCGDADIEVESIHHDSRQVGPNTLFVALRGEQFDGHQFVDAAVQAGACAVLVESDFQYDADVPVLQASDTRRILGLVAAIFFGHPSRELTVVGITGTNGKTSSSYLLEAVLKAADFRSGVIGTIEYRWEDRQIAASNTTPDGLTLQRIFRSMVDDGVEVVVVEVSSHGLANGRVEGTHFDLALFTNLSRDHVDFHGSMDEYRRAKWRLFDEFLPASQTSDGQSPTAVINVDGDEGRKLARHLRERDQVSTITCAVDSPEFEGSSGHFGVANLELSLDGLTMDVCEKNGDVYTIFAPLPGRFNVQNTLGIIASARTLGIPARNVARGLAESDGIPGRMQRVEVEFDAPAVFVDYAHTPDALQQALTTLRPLAKGRLWVVFGCGGDRDRTKRAPMGGVAADYADCVLVTSDNPRNEDPEQIIDEIYQGIGHHGDGDSSIRRQVDRRAAIFDAILRAAPEDVILIAGKGHETYQERNGTRRDFDDREVAARALRRRGEQ